MILQACDDFLDELLTQDIGNDGIVPDIRANEGSASDKSAHSTSMFDFMVKEEPLCEDDLRALQKDRVKKDNHNMSKDSFVFYPLRDFCGKFFIFNKKRHKR